MSYEVSNKFWTSKKAYPDYPHLLNRRLLDLHFILSNIGKSESILDLGCATCSMLILLRELTKIKTLYGFDISSKMLRKDEQGLIVRSADLTKKNILPITDITYCFGMFPYIFDEKDLLSILSNIKSDIFLVRCPCTERDENEYINKYSDRLNDNYSAIYRTIDSYKVLFSKFFNITKIIRSYPDEIESKYRTKHYYFIGKLK